MLTKISQGGRGAVYHARNIKTKFAASVVYTEYEARSRADMDFIALAARPVLVEELRRTNGIRDAGYPR